MMRILLKEDSSRDIPKRRWLGSKLRHGPLLALVFLIGSTRHPAKVVSPPRPLYEQGRDAIIKNYTFVNDFSQKESEREVSDELFWQYPLKIPKIEFEIDDKIGNQDLEIPKTIGTGRPVEHLNRGRISLFSGNYEEAKATFLTARARFGITSDYHRRTDYFTAWTMLKLATDLLKNKSDSFADPEVKTLFANAATFYSWAFIKKRNIPDAQVDINTPKSLANMAAIYYRYERYAAAYGAAISGLDYLRASGGTAYRIDFRRVVAESMILNRSYLKAVQELDTAIRQDSKSVKIASAFARVGDIYFDLNNYELAEDAYALAIAIDADRSKISSAQMVLRGESLFWMGRFSESQKMLAFGLLGESTRTSQADALPEGYASWAKLRIGDGFLARSNEKQPPSSPDKNALLESARIQYFQVEDQYPKSEAAKIARIRRACLELPFYEGKNIPHARELLEKAQSLPLAPQAIELSWACRTGSYAQRDRTPEMVSHVREFANLYPSSRFLNSLAGPVREVQGYQFESLLKSGQPHLALQFFEKNRKNLFPKVNPDMALKLFSNYVDLYKSEAAEEFWPVFNGNKKSYLEYVKSAIFAAEMRDLALAKKSKAAEKWHRVSESLANSIEKIEPDIDISPLYRNFVSRLASTDSAQLHLPWIYRLVSRWSQTDTRLACELKFPLLSRLVTGPHAKEDRIRSIPAVLKAVDDNLPGLLETDYDCGSSLLELENTVLTGNSDMFSKRWLARTKWPMAREVVKHLWLASETMSENGQEKSAQEIWRHLSQSAPKDFPEVKFATIRLDPERTEFEGLWK
jgi:tetratricopeptide (TPR) repeat protein